jgi:2-polyprenyl-3-methyl-5-hydroxy-6-metoxy-1,4-benzoquinol methylase
MIDKRQKLEFEAERHWIICDLLKAANLRPEQPLNVLDFGYLHGLTQEFFHRAFPNAKIDVCERPSSPVFRDKTYMAEVERRTYLKLIPCDLADFPATDKKYDVIVVGEVIEHLDPSLVAKGLEKWRAAITPGGVLIITTPNGAGLYNCYMTLSGKVQVQDPPIPDDMMGFGHIHLWSSQLLAKTANHFGWALKNVSYFHGLEGEIFATIKHPGTRWKSKLFARALKLVVERKPHMRGFFVASFMPS